MKGYKIFLFIAFGGLCLKAQKMAVTDATIESGKFDCQIIQTKQKLNKKYFASTIPVHLRANNNEYVYATLQLGKRKNNIFLFIEILDKNVCIKKDKNMDIYYKTGQIITYKNDFPVNCNGFFVKQFNSKEIKKLSENEISMIKIYTYHNNYEFYLNNSQNYEINNQISCLSNYEIKN